MTSGLNWIEIISVGGTAATISVFVFAIWSWVEHRARHNGLAQSGEPAMPHQAMTFEFGPSGQFEYACSNGCGLLRDLGLTAPDWSRFRAVMADRFCDLPGGITAVDRSRLRIHRSHCIADPMVLDLDHRTDGLTVQMRANSDPLPEQAAQLHNIFSSFVGLDMIRAASENAPYPVWQTLGTDRIGWTNAAYRDLDALITRSASLVGAPLFALPDGGPSEAPRRVQIRDQSRNKTYWFDVISRPVDHGQLHFAIDVHAVVNAESAQRNFVQTLAKTFAHLATGLAIFDRNRQLALFNPALIDLTDLPADFLSARPNLFSFFDQLRNNHIMPEPKSYANWRERIADVVSAASDGNFSETWHLPSGVTYQVTGRPHPDGAIAFLIEDISAEILLTRRFRSEVQITQSALDALGDCIAVFAANGALLHINRAMRGFLGDAAPNGTGEMGVVDVTRSWQSRCQPNPVWGDIRDFVAHSAERETWSADVLSLDGRRLTARISPLTAGATMVTFRWCTRQPETAMALPKPAKNSRAAVA